MKTPQDLLHDCFRDAAKSTPEKGRNKKAEEAILQKELELYRQTYSSDNDEAPPSIIK